MIYLNVGPSRAFRLKIREILLEKIARRACAEAERRKGETLTKAEVREVFEYMRDYMHKKYDFFCLDGAFNAPKMPITEYLKSKGVVEEKHEQEDENGVLRSNSKTAR